MKEKRYLAKNIGFLTISQFGTKMLSFFLVPLYTYVLSTSEYGTFDLYSTTVSLLVPILTLNIADPILRFPLDKDSDIEEIISVGIKYFLIGTFSTAGLVLINRIFNFVPLFNEYPFLLLLMFIASAINGIFISFARGLDKIKEAAISGVVCSITMISLNILFLLFLKTGLKGYFGASIIGMLMQSTYLCICIKFWNMVSIKQINKKLESEMVEYARPLLINNISWWVSSASDRYIVTWLQGVAANGIYSVGYKIPTILNIFQSIFAQAWTLSAVHDFDPEDKKGFFTDMYNSYNFCMTFVCSLLIASAKIMARFLYSKDFYIAWMYVPFLLISIVFSALSGYIGGIFAAVKDTKIFAKTSMVGAVTNIILNIILIKYIGALGAAISTAICYLIIWIMRMISVKKYITLHLNVSRDIISYLVLLAQSIVLLCMKNVLVLYSIEAALILFLLILYRTQIKKIIVILKRKLGYGK